MITGILVLTATLAFPILGLTGIDAFLSRPVLIQEIDSNGTVKNQFLDSFQPDEKSSRFIKNQFLHFDHGLLVSI